MVIALHNGARPDGTIIAPPMSIPAFRHLSDRDAAAIAAHLHQQPAGEEPAPAKEAVRKLAGTTAATSLLVSPAQAGAHPTAARAAVALIKYGKSGAAEKWIPAFAGKTMREIQPCSAWSTPSKAGGTHRARIRRVAGPHGGEPSWGSSGCHGGQP
jgi:hypothetical protein